MKLIKNYKDLAINEERKKALKILEAGLTAIQPQNVLRDNFEVEGDKIYIKNKALRVDEFERIFLIGFGKGSAQVSAIIENRLGKLLTAGMVIDTIPQKFKKIVYQAGTHPLPSKVNVDFTKKVLEKFSDLTDKDLVFIVTCGGGSALFELPHKITLKKLTEVSHQLINSGAEIDEINIVRKHLSLVKGGGLAKHLYPARIVNLVFSDVPGNDFSVIASGPTNPDKSTVVMAKKILSRYKISNELVADDNLIELPKEEKYFKKVSNILMLSNKDALEAMSEEAKKVGIKPYIFTDAIRGDAKKVGKRLITQTPPNSLLLAGGETTIKVNGTGKGGRNQALALACLPVSDDTLVLAFDSDGVDYYYYGGALVDSETNQKAKKLEIDPASYLGNDDSYGFFKKTNDGIFSGKLGSNVTDLIMILRK